MIVREEGYVGVCLYVDMWMCVGEWEETCFEREIKLSTILLIFLVFQLFFPSFGRILFFLEEK